MRAVDTQQKAEWINAIRGVTGQQSAHQDKHKSVPLSVLRASGGIFADGVSMRRELTRHGGSDADATMHRSAPNTPMR